MGKYYDGTKLLSLRDINRKKPEIYMCTSNRTAGKTTYFGRMFVNRFFDKKEKFALLYRYNYELVNVHEKFFKDLNTLFFPGHSMTSKAQANGKYFELFLDDMPCGYALALNDAEQIKKFSHLLSDVKRILFDEFQSETNKYCPHEIEKLISIHTSIARGNGEQVRYVPIFMLANTVSIINPYYTTMGISHRLQSNTKFLKGDGFVLEQGYIDSASRAQKESGFNRAFSDNKYTEYSAESVYLNDNNAFIAKPAGQSRYICTLRYNGKDYAVREYADAGVIYCDENVDITYPLKISVTTDDHNINYVMLKRNDILISSLREFFEHGCFRFKNLSCKEVIMQALSYH